MPHEAEHDLTITGLGAQGDGIARRADATIFVPFALPGEMVRAETRGDHARLIEVTAPSPDRARPGCKHFGSCGGCVAQHMAPELYQTWKRGIVADAFARAGIEAEIAPLVNVATGSRRRAVLSARREGPGVILGFHRMASDAIEPISECPVLEPSIVARLPAVRELAAVLLRDCREVRCTVLATLGGHDLGFETVSGRISPESRARLVQLGAGHGFCRLTLDGTMLLEQAKPAIRFGAVDVVIPASAFVQAVGEAEAAMAALVVEAAGKAKRVADLFCGAGAFTFPLARKARVLAVDGDKAAIAALKEAARAPGIKPVETRVRDLYAEPLSAKELEPFDAVIFDPPRAGAKAQAEMLAKSKVGCVIAVSCNPTSLARDAAILIAGGYRLLSVTPIDQFVYSAHVEAIAAFGR